MREDWHVFLYFLLHCLNFCLLCLFCFFYSSYFFPFLKTFSVFFIFCFMFLRVLVLCAWVVGIATTTTSWVWAECSFGWRNTWTVPQCVSVYKYSYLRMLNNPSQRRRGDKQAKTSKIIGFYAVKNGKKSSNGPPFGSFSREKKKTLISCQNDQCLRTIIFCKLDHFWAALWTKNLFPSQNRDFENGVIVKIQKP